MDLSLLTGSSGSLAAQEAEWLRVYRHFGPRVESFFARRLPSRPELDVFVSDLWERVVLNVHTLRSPKAMWSWLTTIGNNLLQDRYRREKAKREILWSDAERDERVVAVIAGWTGDVTHDDDSAGHRLLSTLTPEEYEFLALYGIDHLSHSEIAKRLGLASADASRQKLRRLRLRLTDSADEE